VPRAHVDGHEHSLILEIAFSRVCDFHGGRVDVHGARDTAAQCRLGVRAPLAERAAKEEQQALHVPALPRRLGLRRLQLGRRGRLRGGIRGWSLEAPLRQGGASDTRLEEQVRGAG